MTDEIRTFDPAAAGWELLLRDGFGGLVGPFWRRQPADGGVRLGLLTRREHANANGVVHGGAILALADQGLGQAGLFETGGQKQATIQLDVHFVAAARPGQFLECRTEVTRRARGVLFLRGEILTGDKLIAVAQGVWKVAEPKG